MDKNNNDLELLLKQSMKKEFPVPDEIDRKTRIRMRKIKETKQSHFIRMLIVINILLTGLEFIILWQLNVDFTQKFIVSAIFFSLFNLLLLLYIINHQSNIKKEIVL